MTTDTTPTTHAIVPEMPDDIRELLTAIPVQTVTAVESVSSAHLTTKKRALSTDGYIPPWARLQTPKVIAEFTVGTQTFLEPLVHEEPNPLVYPMCTVGYLTTSNNSQGSGVLVGPNLLLTAAHMVPWGVSGWWMRFAPAYRLGNEPLGVSYVQNIRGYSDGGVTGHDYAICQLYNPLGKALGWMGARSFGRDDDYYNRRYVSSGYPGTYGGRPAVELDMGIRDIDNDSPGEELEFALRNDLTHGWSGGPLWLPNEGPSVVGVCSGSEKDGLDPTRIVYAAGSPMVDLVKYGLATWPA